MQRGCLSRSAGLTEAGGCVRVADERTRIELQARFNALSVCREALLRRFPSLQGMGAQPPEALPRPVVAEWQRLQETLAELAAQLDLRQDAATPPPRPQAFARGPAT